MENNVKCVTISGAAQILNLGETRARAILDPPDEISYTLNFKPKFLYSKERVEEIARQRNCEKFRRSENKGKRPCYLCRNKYLPSELTSGMCPDCRAMKMMRNFVCHGDCLLHKPDCKRVKCLCSALKKMIAQTFPAGKEKKTLPLASVPSTINRP